MSDCYTGLIQYNKHINSRLKVALQPLLKRYNINYFYYVRYVKGQVFFVCTDLLYLTDTIESKMFADLSPVFLEQMSQLQLNCMRKFIWTGKSPDKVHDVLFERDIWNGYTTYELLSDGLEIWGFGTSRENTGIVNFYLNESHVLRKFIMLLKDQEADLIDYSVRDRRIKSNFILPQPKMDIALSVSDPFLNKNIKRFYFNERDYITRRELDCIVRMMHFRSAKEIAAELGLSHRTVEKHAENIRVRLKCNSVDSLLSLLLKSDLLNPIFMNDLFLLNGKK